MTVRKFLTGSLTLVIGVFLVTSCMSSLPWILISGYALFNPPRTEPWVAPGPMPLNDGSWERLLHEEGSFPGTRDIVTWRHDGQVIDPGERFLPLARTAASSTDQLGSEKEIFDPEDGRPSFERPAYSRLMLMVSLDPDLAVVALRKNGSIADGYAFDDFVYVKENQSRISSIRPSVRGAISSYAGPIAPRGQQMLVVSGQKVLLDISDIKEGEEVQLVESDVTFVFSVSSSSTIEVQRLPATTPR